MTLLRHSFLYLLARAVPAAIGLLALALYTRLLSPDAYGAYALVVAAMSFVNAVFFHWVSLSLGRLLPAYDTEPTALLSTALLGFFVAVCVTGVLGALVAGVWPNQEFSGFVLFTVVLAASQAWFDLQLAVANARLAPMRYGVLQAVKAVVALSSGLSLYYLGFGVPGILLGLFIGFALSSLQTWSYWRGCSLRRASPGLVKSFLAYGAPLTLTFLLILVVNVSDRFMLSWIMNTRAVGAYSAVYFLTQLSLCMVAGVVHLAAFPLAVRKLEQQGVEAARAQLRENGYLLAAVTIPAGLGFVLLGDSIAAVALGAEFREGAGRLTAWIAVATLLGAFKAYYVDYSFQLGRRMRLQVWTVAGAALVNVVLNLLWIPVYGVMGAAYATFAAFVAGIGVSAYLGRRAFSLPFPAGIWKVGVASLMMAAVLWPIRSWRGVGELGLQLLAGGGVYVLILLMLVAGQDGITKVFRFLSSAGSR